MDLLQDLDGGNGNGVTGDDHNEPTDRVSTQSAVVINQTCDDRWQGEKQMCSPIQGMFSPECTYWGNCAFGQELNLFFELVVLTGCLNPWISILWIDGHKFEDSSQHAFDGPNGGASNFGNLGVSFAFA